MCTSFASLLVEWRMEVWRGKKILVTTVACMVTSERSRPHINKLQPGTHYIFGNKMVTPNNTNVWIWITITQNTETTWNLALLV